MQLTVTSGILSSAIHSSDAVLHNAVLVPHVLVLLDRNNSHLFAQPVDLIIIVIIIKTLNINLLNLDLNIGSPELDKLDFLPTFIFQSKAARIDLINIPSQLKKYSNRLGQGPT